MMAGQNGESRNRIPASVRLIGLGALSFIFPFILVAVGLWEFAWTIGWVFQFALAPSLVIWGIGKLLGRM